MGKEHKEHTWDLIAKKLAGEASPAEIQELDELLRANPELHYPVQTIADLWEHTHPENKKQAEEAFSRHLDRIEHLNIDYSPTLTVVTDQSEQKDQRRPRRNTKMLILLPVTLLVVGAILLIIARSSRLQEIAVAAQPKVAAQALTTNTGKRTTLMLSDGTRVWLNAGSHIEYIKNFGDHNREVSLVGEAFFDVAPDASHPFIIHTRKVDVRVLGTRFNLKSYPTDKTTEATLIGGSIEISIHNRPSDKIILKPNEKLVVNNDDSLLQTPAPRRKEVDSRSLVVISKPTYEQRSGAIIETSWVDNKLIFQDEEFGDLAKQMERWYGDFIRFEDPRMMEMRFTGTFEKETITQALEALKLTTQTARFDYSMEGNVVTIHD